MRVYAYERAEHDDIWFGVRPDAQKYAKGDVPAVYRPSIRIHERIVETDKAGVLKMLNGGPIYTTVRSWSMNSRGALVEVTE